ncbi:hypothetical protein OEZ84_27460, partial [Leclercia adecarboxylata]
MPTRTGRPTVLDLKILNRIAKILIDLLRRHSLDLYIALGQIIEKRAGVETVVRHDHGIVI